MEKKGEGSRENRRAESKDEKVEEEVEKLQVLLSPYLQLSYWKEAFGLPLNAQYKQSSI